MGEIEIKGFRIGKFVITNVDNIRNAKTNLTMKEAEHIAKKWIENKRYLRLFSRKADEKF
jgi:hypothetical protein